MKRRGAHALDPSAELPDGIFTTSDELETKWLQINSMNVFNSMRLRDLLIAYQQI